MGLPSKGSHGLRGITKAPSGKWRASIFFNGRKVGLGSFIIKEQAAAAYDRSARLNHVTPVCNYASQMDADKAIREAIEYNMLINAGEMELIMEGHGPAKQEEAYQHITKMVPIWRKIVAAVVLRKAKKTAATERATERACWCRAGTSAGSWYRLDAGAPRTSRIYSSSACAGSRPPRCRPSGTSSSW
jgi:hypothetical protein